MLGRNKKKAERTQGPAVEPFTYIHRGTTLTGTLEASGRVRVHGTIHGNVKVAGVLEVAEAGVVEGDLIEATEVKILGRVQADVHATGKIEIWKDGTLVGDVRAAALDIEEGAAFTGRSEMAGDRKAPAARLSAGIAPRPGALAPSEPTAVLEQGAPEAAPQGREVEPASRD